MEQIKISYQLPSEGRVTEVTAEFLFLQGTARTEKTAVQKMMKMAKSCLNAANPDAVAGAQAAIAAGKAWLKAN